VPQLRSNRSGHATTVLGAVRARHNDIERIERTLLELNQLFRDLTEQIDIQNPLVQQTEEQTEHVKADTEAANVQLNKSIKNAKCARRIKWIICIILTIIVLGVALGLGLWFGVFQKSQGGGGKPPQTTAPGTVVTVLAPGAPQATATATAAAAG
jgi:syntaxin 1B/2/3